MGFFEKLKRAVLKIKGKLIVSAILVLIIIVWAIAPLSVSIKQGFDGIPEELRVDLDNIMLTRKGLDLANIVWEEFV